MAKESAGLLMYRLRSGRLEVLLAHPGGPFWKNKDEGAWSVPKGELEEGEDRQAAAKREFEEETGIKPAGPFIELRPIQQKSGKVVYCWAFEGDCDPGRIKSNTTQTEWPPHSGKIILVPEIDRAEFFALPEARKKANPAQVALLDELEAKLRKPG